VSEDPRGAAGELADGSDRSVPAPAVTARDWTRTRTSDATEPPPPVDVAVVEAVRLEAASDGAAEPAGARVQAGPAVSYGDSPKAAVRTAGDPRRPTLPVQGLTAALVGGLLTAAAWAGSVPLLVAVLVVQVVLVRALLSVLGAPAAGGAAVVAVAGAAAADALVLVDDGAVDRVAGVLGLSLVAALLHQLVRRGRSRVTESLADTVLAAVACAAAACLLALGALDDGREVLLLALPASGTALLLGRVVDRVLPGPELATGSTRGWPGLLTGVLAGVGTAVALGTVIDGLSPAAAALLGLAAAVTVATADLAVDLGAAELRPGRRDARRVSALRPAAALLPYAVLGPVALLAGRLVLS
jgi:hypothetical protein